MPWAEHPSEAPRADRELRRTHEPPRDPGPEQHIDVERPGELVGISLLLGRTAEDDAGRDLAAHRDRHRLLSPLGGARDPQAGQSHLTPNLKTRPASRYRSESSRLVLGAGALGQRQRVPRPRFPRDLAKLSTRHSRIYAGRPQTNGNVEALYETIRRRVVARCLRWLHPPELNRAEKSLRPTCASTITTAFTAADSRAAAPLQTSSTVPER